MTKTRAFIARHPVATYFVLAFALSWAGVLAVGGSAGIPAPAEESEALFPLVFLAMLVGPSVAGLLVTGLVGKRAGLRELRSRLLRWRVSARWYAVALLTAPLVLTATFVALSPLSSDLRPDLLATDDRASLLLLGFAVGLGAGIFEELGWTGFAVPRLGRRFGVLATGLIVGVLWGAWHLLVNYWGSGTPSGQLSLALFVPTVVTAMVLLPAYRVLMVWVYDRTGSVLVAMLMHASLTASTLILLPRGASSAHSVAYTLVAAGGLWILVAAVATKRRQPARRPLRPHAA